MICHGDTLESSVIIVWYIVLMLSVICRAFNGILYAFTLIIVIYYVQSLYTQNKVKFLLRESFMCNFKKFSPLSGKQNKWNWCDGRYQRCVICSIKSYVIEMGKLSQAAAAAAICLYFTKFVNPFSK